MELDRVDQLPIAGLNHHLVLAKVGGSQQFEPLRNAGNLNAVVLPDPEDIILFSIILPNA